MTILASRTSRVAVAALLQCALLPIAVAGPLSARLTGEEYLLEVAPVDPIDPFRGAYVALRYPGLPNDRDRGDRDDDGSNAVYVPLARSGEVWVGLPVVSEEPESGPFLRCEDEHWRLECGIDSFFVAEDRARALEQAVQDGNAVARVAIDSRGNAALVGIDVSGVD